MFNILLDEDDNDDYDYDDKIPFITPDMFYQLEDDIEGFNIDASIEFEDEDDYPVIEIRNGYYEGMQLDCDDRFLTDKQCEYVVNFYDELVDKYGLAKFKGNGWTGLY